MELSGCLFGCLLAFYQYRATVYIQLYICTVVISKDCCDHLKVDQQHVTISGGKYANNNDTSLCFQDAFLSKTWMKHCVKGPIEIVLLCVQLCNNTTQII